MRGKGSFTSCGEWAAGDYLFGGDVVAVGKRESGLLPKHEREVCK